MHAQCPPVRLWHQLPTAQKPRWKSCRIISSMFRLHGRRLGNQRILLDVMKRCAFCAPVVLPSRQAVIMHEAPLMDSDAWAVRSAWNQRSQCQATYQRSTHAVHSQHTSDSASYLGPMQPLEERRLQRLGQAEAVVDGAQLRARVLETVQAAAAAATAAAAWAHHQHVAC